MSQPTANPPIQTLRAASGGLQIESVVLLVDRSRSMASRDYPPNRIGAAVQAVQAFHDAKRHIDPRDRIAVMQFNTACTLVVGFGDCGLGLEHQLAIVRASGSTAIGEALAAGTEMLIHEGLPGSVRRIVLLSDGSSNSGPEPLHVLTRCQRERAIIDTVGIGSANSADYRKGEPLLRELAAATGGTFVYCPDIARLVAQYRTLAAKKPPVALVR